jgi:hypothetical protein
MTPGTGLKEKPLPLGARVYKKHRTIRDCPAN